jgi:malate synthase
MNSRLSFPNIEGTEVLFTDEFQEYLVSLHDLLSDRILEARKERIRTVQMVHENGIHVLELPISEINTTDWQVDSVPDDLKQPGIEISGPAGIASMFINAVNPGPEGERAVGYLDDDEDSGGHSFADTVNSALNRMYSVTGSLRFEDISRGRVYEIEPGPLPFFMHRERGLHLDETDVTIDGNPVSATILSTALTLFHAGKEQINLNQGVYFYLPKLESVEETSIYHDMFEASRELLKLPQNAIIKAIILVESLPTVFRMENMLYALGPYGAGLNAARWDLKASILEYIMADDKSIWPDRFDVDVKTTEFISNIFRRLVAVCLKHGAVAIGGMATALPSRDEEINELAANSIRSDKEWEARQGFLRGWSAHIYHMKTASDPFTEWWSTGWVPPEELKDPANFPLSIETPIGAITTEGTRRNIRTIIEYVEGWLSGRGAKGIDSMEGREGKRPALMEDLATARISVGQVSQRIIHSAVGQDTEQTHTLGSVRHITDIETDDILKLRSTQFSGKELSEIESRYKASRKITLRWIKNYTDMDFRSLGSYTREDLANIALEPEAF